MVRIGLQRNVSYFLSELEAAERYVDADRYRWLVAERLQDVAGPATDIDRHFTVEGGADCMPSLAKSWIAMDRSQPFLHPNQLAEEIGVGSDVFIVNRLKARRNAFDAIDNGVIPKIGAKRSNHVVWTSSLKFNQAKVSAHN